MCTLQCVAHEIGNFAKPHSQISNKIQYDSFFTLVDDVKMRWTRWKIKNWPQKALWMMHTQKYLDEPSQVSSLSFEST